MYAKLVMSSAPSNYNDFCRDIIRLITSGSPSTSLLSSGTWNVAACVIIDATPAGWTYVGSNFTGESGSIAAVNTGGTAPGANNSDPWRWVASSACASPLSSKTKYIVMTSQYIRLVDAYYGTQAKYNCCLGSAVSSTSGGVLTNEASRTYAYQSIGSSGPALTGNDWGFAGTGTYHLIANARHVTLIKENSNVQAVWEHAATDPHVFYNNAPVLFYSWSAATAGSAATFSTNTGVNNVINDLGYNGAWVMNLTDTSTGTTYGSRLVNVSASSNYYDNGANQPYLWPYLNKVTTSNSTGLARQLVSPIMFHLFHHGYPTMYVTGTVPVYMMKGGAGTTGDSINVNGTIYTYFNVNAAMGLAMLTN